MHNRSLFNDGLDIINLANQADANTDITGDWVKLRDYPRAYVLLSKFGSEDVDDLGLQLLQATDATGAGSKALSCITRTWYKTGTLTSQTVWVPGTAIATPTDFVCFGASVPTGATRVVADVNTSPLLLLVEILATDLDVANGFDWFTAFIEGDNVDNSCLITLQAILKDCKFMGALPPSAIS
jgi:hypothetical protein